MVSNSLPTFGKKPGVVSEMLDPNTCVEYYHVAQFISLICCLLFTYTGFCEIFLFSSLVLWMSIQSFSAMVMASVIVALWVYSFIVFTKSSGIIAATFIRYIIVFVKRLGFSIAAYIFRISGNPGESSVLILGSSLGNCRLRHLSGEPGRGS